MFVTQIERGSYNKFLQHKNQDILSELITFGKSEDIAKKIIARLQYIRHQNGFFSEDFKISFDKKFSYFNQCFNLLKDNELPLHAGGLRDQCILRLIGPFFMFQKKQRTLARLRKKPLPELTLKREDIWNLMEKYKIDKYFIKDLYSLHDSDMDGGFLESMFMLFKNGGELPKFLTS